MHGVLFLFKAGETFCVDLHILCRLHCFIICLNVVLNLVFDDEMLGI